MDIHKKDKRLQLLNDLFARKRVCSFQEILDDAGCPEITTRRDLKEIKAISSYSHQRRFLTLPTIPTFNEYGIWQFNGIGFSRYKDSLELIVNVINSSEKGLTREDIEKILRIKIFQQIQVLLTRNKLNRAKVGNRYVYLPEELVKSKKLRVELLDAREAEEYHVGKIKITDLIAVLKALLAEHMIDMDNLEKVIRKYSLGLSIQKIEQIILKFDLSSKKNVNAFEGLKGEVSK